MWLREQTKSKSIIKQLIREYYSRKPLEEPSYLHKREVALESLEDSAYIRHLSFPYMENLYNYILNYKTPLHLYYSSAMYAHPSAQRMEDKLWEGSELLFDIDADKYPECSTKYWICPDTGEIYESEVEKCKSGSNPLEYVNVPWSCIEKAWEEALKLVDILSEDLGFKDIKVYFSGNRGFHVKVFDSRALHLSKDARKAIAEYVSCTGLLPEKVMPEHKGKVIFTSTEHGLRNRVLRELLKRGLGELKPSFKGLRNVYVVDAKAAWDVLREVCVEVDKAVTMDISRLSRFGKSLNMKSGLRTLELNKNKEITSLGYNSFSPYAGVIRLKPLVTAKLPVLDKQVELVRGGELKLEAYLAIYLIAKGVALPTDVRDLEVRA